MGYRHKSAAEVTKKAQFYQSQTVKNVSQTQFRIGITFIWLWKINTQISYQKIFL